MPSSFHTPRKHTVPTHLNLPDQVLTLWAFTLTARQLLLLLAAGGLAGDCWHELAVVDQVAVVGPSVRVLCTLIPLLVALVVASYRYAGRYLEVWCVVLVRYWVHPRCYVWRSMRTDEPSLVPLLADTPALDEEEVTAATTLRTSSAPTRGTRPVLAEKKEAS